jgi:hypothetical protein
VPRLSAPRDHFAFDLADFLPRVRGCPEAEV